MPLAEGASCTFEIDFAPTSVGAIQGSVVVTDNINNAAAPNYGKQTIQLNATALPPASLISPTPGSTLTATTVTFGWSSISGITQFKLDLGTVGRGSYNIYEGSTTTKTSQTVPKLPWGGKTLYARLYYLVNSTWKSSDATYITASPAPPSLISPDPNNFWLNGPTQTFTWNPGVGSTSFRLTVGSGGTGSDDVYNGRPTDATSATVYNIPFSNTFVRLYYLTNSGWNAIDYLFGEGTPASRPTLTSPAAGSTLTGSSATFTWNPGLGSRFFDLFAGTGGPGSQNVFVSGSTTSSSVKVSNIPTNGAPLYVSLRYFMNQAWQSIDYVYTESGSPTLPFMTLPAPDSKLTGSSQTFTWDRGAGANLFELEVGTTAPGSQNVYRGGPIAGASVTVNNIPTNGKRLYVTLYYRVGGDWKYILYTYTEQ
jgi:hypothetical protein